MAKYNFSLAQASEILKELSDTVLRNDERLKSLISEQENFKKHLLSLEERAQKTEVNIGSFSARIGGHDEKWKFIIDLIWKIVIMIISGYILYALGLQADLAFPPP